MAGEGEDIVLVHNNGEEERDGDGVLQQNQAGQAGGRGGVADQGAARRDDPDHLHWMPQPRLPRFDGSGPVDEFVEEVHRVVDAYKMRPAISLELILRHLDGQARREVLSMGPEERLDIWKVTGHLSRTFGDRRHRVHLLEEFNQRRQRPGESVLEFAHDLQALARKLNTSAPGSVSDNDLRDRFAERIANPSLRRELRRMRSANTEIKLGALKDAALQFLQDEAEEEVAHIQSHSAQPAPIATDPRIDQLTKVVAELAAIVNGQTQRRSRGCFNCGELDHIKRNCPTMKKKGGN